MPTKYKIPKNRFRQSTIKMKNSTLVGEADDQGNMYWFRNGKYITPNQMKKYKYYDSNIKGYRTLGDRATMDTSSGIVDFKGVYNPVYTPSLDYLKNILNTNASEKHRVQAFKSNNKLITLKTKGKMNLATIPTNMLDSIAINAGRAGTDIKTGLGLIGKESTFGGFSIPLGDNAEYIKSTYFYPGDLTNNHSYFVSPEDDYLKAIYRKYKNMNENDAVKIQVEKDAEYALRNGLITNKTPHYNENIMADAFERYNKNPKTYNPGQQNYVPMVNNIGDEVFGDKTIQSWWKSEGINHYNKGLNERRRLESRGKLTK